MAVGKEDYVSIGTWPTPERTVRVALPGKVAVSLRDFQKVQASILDRLGCPACCSGWDIRYDVITNFRVDEQLNVHDEVAGGIIIDG